MTIHSLFNFAEEIFLISDYKENKDTGLIAFTNQSNSHMAIYEFSLINFNEKYENFVKINILNICIANISDQNLLKIRFKCSSKSDKSIIKVLKDLDFVLVGTFKDEYGKNIDEKIYEKRS